MEISEFNADSVDPDQMPRSAFWTGSTLFVNVPFTGRYA